MLILGIETCLSSGFVFLGDEENVLISFKLPPQSSSKNLGPLITSVLQKVNVPIGRIGAVVVSKGPGSFTGSRIGVSLAKSLSFCLGIPLVGVPTLDCIAFSLSLSGFVCSLIPAYRDSFFAAFFYKDAGYVQRLGDYLFLPFEKVINQATQFLPEEVVFAFFPEDAAAAVSSVTLPFGFSIFEGKLNTHH